jgi:hypothetical protein
LGLSITMVIVNSIPGQEERSANYLLRKGRLSGGTTCPPWHGSSTGCWATRHFLVALRTIARRIARPHAARDVVAALGAAAGQGEVSTAARR